MAKPRGVFITGSDTGVGKTYFACALIRALEQNGVRTAPRKPIESGCTLQGDNVIVNDALQMAEAMQNPEPLNTICPYRLQAAVSPLRAAQLQGIQLSCDDLLAACQCADDAVLIVEGAGGLLSPLANHCSNADLAKKLALPLILVVADKLGCINHTLMSIRVAEAMGIPMLAVVLNRLPQDEGYDPAMDNLAEIRAFTNTPVLKMTEIHKILSCLKA